MTTEPDGGPQPASAAKSHGAATTFDDGTLHINFVQRKVTIDGMLVDLTPIEYRLLAALAHNKGQVLSSRELAWDPDPPSLAPHRVKFFMFRLRHKMGWKEEDSPIEVVRDYG